MDDEPHGSRRAKRRAALGTWTWLGIGLVVGAVAGLVAGNLPAGFGVGATLGVAFAYAAKWRRRP
jgi:mannose/fructose/N-acetylgalactosamine-specific phosphotransferase system component IIC